MSQIFYAVTEYQLICYYNPIKFRLKKNHTTACIVLCSLCTPCILCGGVCHKGAFLDLLGLES